MRAAVVRHFHEPLVIEDRPIPTPGPGQVLVKVEASGLSHRHPCRAR
jgi:propanol-preferring alcohol dehydrogenase